MDSGNIELKKIKRFISELEKVRESLQSILDHPTQTQDLDSHDQGSLDAKLGVGQSLLKNFELEYQEFCKYINKF